MDSKVLAELNKLGDVPSMLDQTAYLRALFYGDPGSGKTDLAGQIVKVLGGKTCLVYADSAWTVLLKYPEIAANVHKYPFGGFSMLNAILDARYEGIAPYCDFNNLIWDTWSTSIDKVLRNLVDQRKYPKEQHDPEVEGWPHYRLVERLFIDLVDKLNKSEMNIIYTAHLRFPNENDQKAAKLNVRPVAPEATYRILARESNLIGYLYKDQSGGERKIQLSGTKTETAKCQIPGIEEQTYSVNEIPKLIAEWRNNNVNLGRR